MYIHQCGVALLPGVRLVVKAFHLLPVDAGNFRLFTAVICSVALSPCNCRNDSYLIFHLPIYMLSVCGGGPSIDP